MNVLKDPKHADITFVVDGHLELEAHKIMLISSSKFFRRVFGMTSSGGKVIFIDYYQNYLIIFYVNCFYNNIFRGGKRYKPTHDHFKASLWGNHCYKLVLVSN